MGKRAESDKYEFSGSFYGARDASTPRLDLTRLVAALADGKVSIGISLRLPAVASID